MKNLALWLCLILTFFMLISLFIYFIIPTRFSSFLKRWKGSFECLLDKLIFPARQCDKYNHINNQDLKDFCVVRQNAREEINNQQCNNIEFNRIVHYAYLRNQLFPNSKYYVIYFHGNGETIDDAAEFVRTLMKSLKFHAFLIEYPNYGIYKHTETSAKIILEDSILAYEKIKEEYMLDESQILIFGRSIGTGPAIYVASQKKCKGLVTISAYKSLKSLIRGMFCGFGYLVSKMMDERFNNEENITKIRCPALFIHGKDDTLIPSSHSLFLSNQLFEQNKKAQHELFSQMTHNNIIEFHQEISEKIAIQFRDLSKSQD